MACFSGGPAAAELVLWQSLLLDGRRVGHSQFSEEQRASAAEAMAQQSGDCTEYALLLAALARANQIPTRVVAGIAYASRFVTDGPEFGPHMWVQVWDQGRWRSYDAGFDRFGAGHIALAYGDGAPQSYAAVAQLIRQLRIVDAGSLPER